MRGKLIWLLLLILSFSFVLADDVNFTSNSTWVVPAGVTQITVEAWGGGGAGGGGATNGQGGAGGGGGQFARSIIAVTAGQNYSIFIGGGGTGIDSSQGTDGGDTVFNNSIVVAKGGTGGGANDAGAIGLGNQSGSIGNVTYYGGNGANPAGDGGGGGGGAGNSSVGGDAAGTTAGAGGTQLGGNGGTGGTAGGLGTPGSIYGGGGGGSDRQGGTTAGANGAQGFLRISYELQNSLPYATLNYPPNDTDISYSSIVLLNVTYHDPDAQQGTVEFINASNGYIFCSNSSIADSTLVLCGINVYSGEENKWYVNTSDGIDTTTNGIWNFTTSQSIMSFSLSYPSSGCSQGDGCTSGGCTACTYCSLKFPYLPISNWNCTGQTDGTSFFTVNNDGGLALNIEARLNETIPNAAFKLGLSSNPYDATVKIINTSYQLITDTAILPSSSDSIWGFGNATSSVPMGNYSLNLSMIST